MLALRFLRWKNGHIVLPYPRVLHKEVFPLQHHGIDALGYESTINGYFLYIIEVMASIDQNHPPTTVKDHLSQILDETLNIPASPRLLKDLQTVHDEATEQHKDILNGFITADMDCTISNGNSVIATPLLVKRFNEYDTKDWAPFLDKYNRSSRQPSASRSCSLLLSAMTPFREC